MREVSFVPRGAPATVGLLTLTAVAVLAATLWMAGGAPGVAEGAPDKRFCGIAPGDGAYSYIKARNVSCRVARKVSRKAGRKFCKGSAQNCDEPPGGGVDRGRVRAKGWRCKMKVGYEFYRAKCVRGSKRFVAESAA